MKKTANIFFRAALALCCLASAMSCDKWLEATSSTQLPADKLFETKSGFYDALTGVYISMGDASLYGRDYTWKINDLTAFPYLTVNAEDFDYWQKHNYKSQAAKSVIKGMWSQGYSTIANINMILRELDARRNIVPYDPEYNMIKGELLALRAYVHFDMIRMFGVNDWSGENASKMTIPYLVKYDKEPEVQRTYAETEQLILKDIKDALVCLAEDPVTGKEDPLFETAANADGYWNRRTKHMNFYAVNALAARFYQWKNDTAKAAEYAQLVIDGTTERKVVEWVDIDEILTTKDDNRRDWSFSSEHIFSLEVTGLYDRVRDYMMNPYDLSAIRVPQDFVSGVLFPPVDPVTGSYAGGEDVRGPALLLRYDALGYSCYKLYGSTGYAKEYRNRIPMIRISEMYYILAENLIRQNDNAKALAMLDVVRKHRGISENLPSTASAEEELMKEYYKEFMAEGQLFFYMKHKKATSSLWPQFPVSAEQLIYPYPDEEINYGRVQEL